MRSEVNPDPGSSTKAQSTLPALIAGAPKEEAGRLLFDIWKFKPLVARALRRAQSGADRRRGWEIKKSFGSFPVVRYSS